MIRRYENPCRNRSRRQRHQGPRGFGDPGHSCQRSNGSVLGQPPQRRGVDPIEVLECPGRRAGGDARGARRPCGRRGQGENRMTYIRGVLHGFGQSAHRARSNSRASSSCSGLSARAMLVRSLARNASSIDRMPRRQRPDPNGNTAFRALLIIPKMSFRSGSAPDIYTVATPTYSPSKRNSGLNSPSRRVAICDHGCDAKPHTGRRVA